MSYILIDWAGNRLSEDTFETFEDGWEYIYENYENEEDYEDLYIVTK